MAYYLLGVERYTPYDTINWGIILSHLPIYYWYMLISFVNAKNVEEIWHETLKMRGLELRGTKYSWLGYRV